jgi:hypothetical protein
MTGICKQSAGFPRASGSLTSVSYERVLAKLINALYGDGLKTALLNSEDAMLFPKMETQGWSHWVVVLKSMTLHATRQHRKCVGPKGAAVTDGAVPHPPCVCPCGQKLNMCLPMKALVRLLLSSATAFESSVAGPLRFRTRPRDSLMFQQGSEK